MFYKLSTHLLISITLVLSPEVLSQAVTLISNSTEGHDCYSNAKRVSRHPDLARTVSVSPCTLALDQPLHYRDKPAILVNRGIILAAHQEYQQAQRDYKKALEINPDLSEAYASIGNLYFIAEQYGKAIEFYDQSLALGLRQDYAIFVNRGMVYEKRGNLVAAEKEYRLALARRPNWQLAQDRLSNVLLRQ